ncbi:spore coat protein U domain-containing protein [Polaromonas sp. YR568]|uniref:spore coat protein U domain-containing protein n=1 Tax=Polaromonas sp. YR568 TaxID=1855301 RepID=UPI00398BFCD7
MKKFFAGSVMALAGLLASPAQAANDSASVSVTINLTSKCVFGTIAPVVFAYTSFQATLANATGGTFNMKCTNTMPYKIGFTNAATPATTEATTDNAVNLAYTLGLSATTGTGSGVDQPYTVTGTMALGQGGTCLTASCTNTAATNKVRTVYVVY